MRSTCIFALGNLEQDKYWFNIVADALNEYGELKVISCEDEITELMKAQCASNLVIIDSGSVDNLVHVISAIRARLSQAKIIVMSATPTWKESRQARYAGAEEYCPKSMVKSEILERVESLIGMP